MEKKGSTTEIHLAEEMKLRETRRELLKAARQVVLCHNNQGSRALTKLTIDKLQTCFLAYDRAETKLNEKREKQMTRLFGPLPRPRLTSARKSASKRSSKRADSKSSKKPPKQKPKLRPRPLAKTSPPGRMKRVVRKYRRPQKPKLPPSSPKSQLKACRSRLRHELRSGIKSRPREPKPSSRS